MAYRITSDMETSSIKVSRAGVEIGTYELSRILDLVAQKKLLPTDHYWQPGMTGWKPLAALIAETEEAKRKERLERERLESAANTKRDTDALRAAALKKADSTTPKEEDGVDFERIFLILIALPFLFYGGAMILNNIERGNFAHGATSTAMTNGLLCFGIGVLLAKK